MTIPGEIQKSVYVLRSTGCLQRPSEGGGYQDQERVLYIF